MRREWSHKPRIVVLVSLALTSFGLWALDSSNVWAAFTAEALSEKNAIRGGSIELRVTPDLTNPTSEQPIVVGESIFYGATVLNHGKNTFRYSIDLVEGDDTDCSIMFVEAKREGTTVYAGALALFQYLSSNTLASGDDEIWSFEFWIPDGTELTETTPSCLIHFQFEAWQAEYALASLGGWTDSVSTPDLTLLPDPGMLPGIAAPIVLDETLPIIEEPLPETESGAELPAPIEIPEEIIPEIPLPNEVAPDSTVPTVPETIPLENPTSSPSTNEEPVIPVEPAGEIPVQP